MSCVYELLKRISLVPFARVICNDAAFKRGFTFAT